MEGKKANKEYVGFTPLKHQWDVIRLLDRESHCKCKRRIVTVVSRRQCGKSLMIENLLLYYAINYSRTVSIAVSPTLSQARKLFKEIVEAIEHTDVMKASNATLLEIDINGGSKIFFKSAEQGDALRGFTVNGIVCIDEAAYIDDRIFYTVLPWVDVNGAPILIVSTPKVKEGFFFENYCYGMDRKGEHYTIDWSDDQYKESLSKLLPPERLEEYRKMLPKAQFTSEYLGQFLDDDGMVFSNFKNCIDDVNIKPTDRLFIGIDWGNGGNDDTVLSGINQKGEQVLLKYWNNLTPLQQINKIADIIEEYGKQIDIIQPELNSIGTPYVDMLKAKLMPQLSSKIRGFMTTNSSKNDLVAQLQVAFEKEEIRIWDDPKQIREIGAYAAEYNPKTKNVSYNAPTGLNDDIVIGVMLSWDAYLKRTTRGRYNVSII